MLADWLAPESLSWFREAHFDRAPIARGGAAAKAVPLFGWDTLSRVLTSRPPLDLMTVSRGRLVDVPAPRTLAEVRALMRTGVSVVVRGSERHDAGLAELAAAFARDLPGEVHVQLYVTPAGTNSYGWHYDFEDVFIVQTAGAKDYYFRANTVARGTALGDPLDFTCITRETSPLYTARLVAGDWLYIPATWWHLVKCTDDALSISVGVMSPRALGSARRLPAGWSGVRS
jgi:hypothetical protein